MEIILEKPRKYHVSQDTVAAFEKIILSDPHVRWLNFSDRQVSNLVYYLWRIADRSGRRTHLLPRSPATGIHAGKKQRDLFVVSMGINLRKWMPFSFASGRKSIYLFDAWPSIHDEVKELILHWNIDNVFLSSSQAAERLGRSVSGCHCYWIPEGHNPEDYRFCSYQDKKIDVLQFGRKYDIYHQLIAAPLERLGKVYLYEKEKGELVFPTQEEFLDGLAGSKISICFPASMTHPVRAGDIETMTGRYLQSMASKCLILGHAPEEMIGLFGYNPVIEIDWDDPVGQLRSVLDRYTEYIPFLEKNYQAVVENHTWQRRWERIVQVLFT